MVFMVNGATRRSVLTTLPGPRRCWKWAVGILAVYVVVLLAFEFYIINLVTQERSNPDAGLGGVLALFLLLVILFALVLGWAMYNLARWPLYPLILTAVGLLARYYQENGLHLYSDRHWFDPFSARTLLIGLIALIVLYGIALRATRSTDPQT